MTDIESALARVRARIGEAALRAGRDPAGIALVAVSKTSPPEAVAEAIAAGQRDFGENRVEEALPKIAQIAARLGAGDSPRWHLIGHLQSRKAKEAVGRFDLIHSVDSARLAESLDRRVAAAHAPPQPVLVECNVSGEHSKNGFDLGGWERDPAVFARFADDAARLLALPNLRVHGLMTMAPIMPAPDLARPFFASLRALRDALRERFPGSDWPHLSMGMTDDFEAAIAEGATLVRIGRAIFGAR
jgi:pyridoxal phosphate enzyme (YggS family)